MESVDPKQTTVKVFDPPLQKPAEQAKPYTLVQKLAAIMGSLSRVAKRGRNEFHKYDYATEADISEAVRVGMAEHGVVMIPNVLNMAWKDVTGKNGIVPMCILTVEFTVTDGATEYKFVMVGTGLDSGDKGPYKALTGAMKYGMLKLFMIATGDDPEKDEKAEPEKKKAARQPEKPADEGTGPAEVAPPDDRITTEKRDAIMVAAKNKWGGKGFTTKRISDHLDGIARGFKASNLSTLTMGHVGGVLDAISSGSDPA